MGKDQLAKDVRQDVTDRDAGNVACEDDRRLNRLLLDSLPHPAMLVRADRTILAANHIAREMGAVIGGLCWETFGQGQHIAEQDKQDINDHGGAAADGTHCTFCLADESLQQQQPTRDPKLRAFDRTWDVHWVPLTDDVYLHYAADVTEREEVEKRLADSEKQSRAWLDGSPICTKILDLDFNLQFMSASGVEALKIDDITEYYGAPYPFPFYPDSFSKPMIRNLTKARATGKTLTQEASVVDVEGNELWFHSTIVPVKDNEDRVEYIIMVSVDITERKQAEADRERLEDQLRQAHKMEAIGQLAGGVAHDFNNILTAIQGNAELLKMSVPATTEQGEFADEIIKGAQRAADLTRQLLAFARKGTWQVVPVDIHDAVTQAVSMLTHTIDKRIEVRLELHASPSAVMGDPTQLHSAMLNLGVNARDAMADGGVLTYATGNVTLTEADCYEHPYELTPGNFLEIRVSDTGAGMEEETQKRIFEPFFTTKEVGQGTGLGLAGVYGCVKGLNGSIDVASTLGQGTTFVIQLPLACADVAPEGQTPSDEPVRGTGHVLVVDDEQSVRDLIEASLQTMGYTVSVCADGAAAVSYYREHHREIDLVILDLIMPEMDGQDAFAEMKRVDPDVRVLVSSGFSQSQATQRILDEGALALLSKPFQITELSQAVATYIRGDLPR